MASTSSNGEKVITVSKYVNYIVKDTLKYSKFVGQDDSIPEFDYDEIHLDQMLGKGGFNEVYSIDSLAIKYQVNPNMSEEMREARSILSLRSRKGEKLAIKCMREKSKKDMHVYRDAAADLVLEAKMLAAIARDPHPNIIQLRGISSGGYRVFDEKDGVGYFLIMDQLSQTLENQLTMWRSNGRAEGKMARRRSDPFGVLRNKEEEGLRKLHHKTTKELERLVVAQQISSALLYLHRRRIIYRDLKPGNVGFDFDGNVKLIDFGLAKELNPNERRLHTFQMTGGVGTVRYMAPEVQLDKPYNLKADCYSFGVLMFEVLTLRRAFESVSYDRHKEVVGKLGYRPKIDQSLPFILVKMIELCWHEMIPKRPTMKSINTLLDDEVRMLEEQLTKPKNDDGKIGGKLSWWKETPAKALGMLLRDDDNGDNNNNTRSIKQGPQKLGRLFRNRRGSAV